MKRRDFIKLLALGAAVPPAMSVMQSCQQSSRPAQKLSGELPRLVVLYAPCTISKFFLSPYNPAISVTPHHQRFAEGGAVFTKHQSEAGDSGIAYASIFTGGQAHHHGIFTHPSRMDFKVPQITEAFAFNGWDVHFFGQHHMASYKLNYAQGIYPDQSYNRFLTGADDTFSKILNLLKQNRNHRAFILTNFTVTHYPYLHRKSIHYDDCKEAVLAMAKAEGIGRREFERFRKIYSENTFNLIYRWDETLDQCELNAADLPAFVKSVEVLYCSAMAYHDELFGQVIKAIEESDLVEESLFIYTADHGEYMYNENELFHFAHGNQLSQASHAVPFIISGPCAGVVPGRYDFVTRSIDVFPSIAGLCGLTIPEELTPVGVDLSPIITNGEPPPELQAYSHTMMRGEAKGLSGTLFDKLVPKNSPHLMQVSVRDKEMVFMIAKTDPLQPDSFQPVAFDLTADPRGGENIFDRADEHHRKRIKNLREYKKSLISAYQLWSGAESSLVNIDEKLEALRQMGYIQ